MGVMAKSKVDEGRHAAAAMAYFSGYHITYIVDGDRGDIRETKIEEKLLRVGGAHAPEYYDLGGGAGGAAKEDAAGEGAAAGCTDGADGKEENSVHSNNVGITTSGEVHVTNARWFTAAYDSPSMAGRINMDVGSTLLEGLLVFVRFVVPLWALLLLALRTMRSWRRTRLPAQRMPRRRPVFRTIGGYWALILLLGKHLLFVGAFSGFGGAGVGVMTDDEFKKASWGTF